MSRFGEGGGLLEPRETGVEAVRRKERGVRSLFHDASGLDDQDAIGVDDCRQPMPDHERGRALHQRLKRALDQRFALGVEGRGQRDAAFAVDLIALVARSRSGHRNGIHKGLFQAFRFSRNTCNFAGRNRRVG
jgi:hypothetical protein